MFDIGSGSERQAALEAANVRMCRSSGAIPEGAEPQ
jgi:hypothetical protein